MVVVVVVVTVRAPVLVLPSCCHFCWRCSDDIVIVVLRPSAATPARCRRIAVQDEQLAVIPVLHEERDMLREALGEERASREEDLHNKDAEIATLQAKVIDKPRSGSSIVCLVGSFGSLNSFFRNMDILACRAHQSRAAQHKGDRHAKRPFILL